MLRASQDLKSLKKTRATEDDVEKAGGRNLKIELEKKDAIDRK